MHQSSTPILDFLFFCNIFGKEKCIYKRIHFFIPLAIRRGFLFYTKILLAQKEWKASSMYHTFCTNKVLYGEYEQGIMYLLLQNVITHFKTRLPPVARQLGLFFVLVLIC